MTGQTDSASDGSASGRVAAPRGPALAILATAPRPGLVLAGLCPPLLPPEASALQTAWLKQQAVELPGVQVYLCGRPADAMPMLRYFAGPGVELRSWPEPTAGDPAAAIASELFASGHGPVLVRTADAPEPGEPALRSCLAAAQRGDFVWAADQHGAAWLCGFPSPDSAELCRQARGDQLLLADLLAAATPPRRLLQGPWARRMLQPQDLWLWLAERNHLAARRQPACLEVRNLQAALQFYEQCLDSELLVRSDDSATVALLGHRLQLLASENATPNGLWLPIADAASLANQLASRIGNAAAARPQQHSDGGIGVTLTDPDGNRLMFASPGTGT